MKLHSITKEIIKAGVTIGTAVGLIAMSGSVIAAFVVEVAERSEK